MTANDAIAIRNRLGSLFTCKEGNGWLTIRTPFLYYDGDYVNVFCVQSGCDGDYIVTDAGEAYSCCQLFKGRDSGSEASIAAIEDICLTHGVSIKRRELVTKCRLEDLAQAVVRVAQASSRIVDVARILGTEIVWALDKRKD